MKLRARRRHLVRHPVRVLQHYLPPGYFIVVVPPDSRDWFDACRGTGTEPYDPLLDGPLIEGGIFELDSGIRIVEDVNRSIAATGSAAIETRERDGQIVQKVIEHAITKGTIGVNTPQLQKLSEFAKENPAPPPPRAVIQRGRRHGLATAMLAIATHAILGGTKK